MRALLGQPSPKPLPQGTGGMWQEPLRRSSDLTFLRGTSLPYKLSLELPCLFRLRSLCANLYSLEPKKGYIFGLKKKKKDQIVHEIILRSVEWLTGLSVPWESVGGIWLLEEQCYSH